MYPRADMQDPWRLVDSGLVEPAESVALDEAILDCHVAGIVPNTLHLYRRRVPTISVGYFQSIGASLRVDECGKRGVAIVRRKSGGSSIYTDRGQLIYGLVVRSADVPAGPDEAFRMICTALANALSHFGVPARYRPLNDVEVEGRKISGSAQLRRKGSVLVHGTVLVDTDVETMDAVLIVDRTKSPDIPRPSRRIVTLSSLLATVPDMESVKARVAGEFEKTFGVQFEAGELTSAEKVAAKKLVDERYSQKDWNFRF